jgi:hypothetical protein
MYRIQLADDLDEEAIAVAWIGWRLNAINLVSTRPTSPGYRDNAAADAAGNDGAEWR